MSKLSSIATVIGLPLAWVAVQYPIVVPIVFLWNVLVWLLKGAAKIGIIGILLLFLPIIGWIILAIMLVNRRQHLEMMHALRPDLNVGDTAPTSAPYWHPWGLSIFKSAITTLKEN